MIPKVAQNLAKKVEEAGFHLDVGVLGAKAILNALSENGYPDVAYKVAVQDTYPSWGWWIVNGATTLLENWDLDAERDISDNHMMFGVVLQRTGRHLPRCRTARFQAYYPAPPF